MISAFVGYVLGAATSLIAACACERRLLDQRRRYDAALNGTTKRLNDMLLRDAYAQGRSMSEMQHKAYQEQLLAEIVRLKEENAALRASAFDGKMKSIGRATIQIQ